MTGTVGGITLDVQLGSFHLINTLQDDLHDCLDVLSIEDFLIYRGFFQVSMYNVITSNLEIIIAFINIPYHLLRKELIFQESPLCVIFSFF